MKSVQVEMTGKHPAPTSNTLKLYACDKHPDWTNVLWYSGIVEIRCSLKLWLPTNMTLSIMSSLPGIYVIGTRIENGEIFLLTVLTGQRYEDILKAWDGVIAIAELVEQTPANVRFIQKAATGGRIITGDAKSVENRDTETDSKPGE